MASYIAKVYPKLESFLIPFQTCFSAKRASLSNGVHCYATLFGDGQDKSFLFIVVHMFASSVYITQ